MPRSERGLEARPRLFLPPESALCTGCEWRSACRAGRTEHACQPLWKLPAQGGEHALHPSAQATAEYLNAVGGPDFDTVVARAQHVPHLPAYLPQIRARRALRGELTEKIYGVRAEVVIGRRPHVLPAGELRELVGLDPTQKLVLVLFDRDEILERLWTEGVRLIPELAEAAYDVILSPSYSAWTPRPRPEFLYNAKRSLVFFQAMQAAGITSVPRAAWITDYDAERFASWINANPEIEVVALDCATYRTPRDWQGQLRGLGRLDRLTGERLRYVINGPTIHERCAEIFTVVPDREVCITNATLAAPPERGPSNQLSLLRQPSRSDIRSRCRRQRAMIRSARASAAQLPRTPL
jgi:hypothetical protein